MIQTAALISKQFYLVHVPCHQVDIATFEEP
jgi:hypothetical protein